MEITEKVIQIPLEDLNYAQLKDVTREEILSFLISKKERILLLVRKLEESEKIKNKVHDYAKISEISSLLTIS